MVYPTSPVRFTGWKVLLGLALPFLVWPLQELLWSIGAEYPFLLFYPSVLLAALLGGATVGIIAAVNSVLIIVWAFLEPRHGWAVKTVAEWVAVSMTLTLGLAVVWYLDRTARRRERSRSAALIDASEAGRLRSLEQLQLAVDGAAIGLWYWPMPGVEVEWDARCRQLFALPPGAKPSFEHLYSVMHPEDRPRIEALIAKAVERRSDYRAEYRVIHPDGAIRWLSAPGRVYTNPDGSPRGMGGVLIDVTERHTAADALERSRRLMAEGERLAGFGTWEYVVATQETLWSEGEYRIYGVDPTEKSPDHQRMMRERIHPDDAAALDREFGAALAKHASFAQEHRIVRPDGSIRIVRHTAHPVFDADGTLLRYIGASRDVTNEVEAAAALRKATAAVEEAELRWKFALEGAAQGVWDWNVERGTVFYSHVYAQMLGYTQDELGTSADVGFGRMHPDDLPSVQAAVEEHNRGGTPSYVATFRIRHKDGHYLWVESHGKIVERLPDGRPKRMTGTHVDITERKAAAEALERMQRLMADGEKLAGFGTWEWVAATGQTSWSEGEYRIFGADPAEASPDYARMLRESIHPDDAAELDRVFGESIQRVAPYAVVSRIVRPDGTVRTTRNMGNPVTDENGRLLRYVGVTADVTEQAQAVAELERSRLLMAEGERIVGLGAFEYDVATRMTRWSDGQFHLHGLDPASPPLDFDGVLRMVHAEDAERTRKGFLAALDAGSSFDAQYRIIRPDGALRHLRTLGRVLHDRTGKVTGFVGASLDVTSEVRAAALLQAQAVDVELLNVRLAERAAAAEAANRAKTAFLGTVSHELRTPLNAIIGFADLLRDGNLGETTEAQRQPIAIIDRSAHDLLALVNEIIDISNIEAGKLQVSCEPVCLRPLLLEARQSVEPGAAQRGLELRPVLCAADLNVRADRKRLAQVMRNLLNNAIKFTDQGSIGVAATVRAGVARIEVTDTGIGIARGDQQKLFEPFERIASTTGPLRQGTGLGLSICRRLVAAMGGEIGVESEPGQGSTFWFTLPLA